MKILRPLAQARGARQEFSKASKHLPHFHHANGVTVVSADLDGDRRADFTLELTGQVRLGGQDFLL